MNSINTTASPEVSLELVLEAENLPSLPGVAGDVLRICKDVDAELQDLVTVVSLDPALAAKLLKLSNTPLFRRGEETKDIPRACVLLGMNTVKIMSLGFSLAQSLSECKGVQGLNYDEFWRHSVSTAVIARGLSRLTKLASPEEAFLSGLLSRMGQLCIALAIPDTYEEINTTANGWLKNYEAEREQLSFSHFDVSASILKSWELSEQFCSVARFWNRPEVVQDEGIRVFCEILKIADEISTVINSSEKGESYRNVLQLATKYFGLAGEEVDRLIIAMEDEIAEMAAVLNVEFGQSVDHQKLLDEARQQIVQISLATAAGLKQSEDREEKLRRQTQELRDQANCDQLTRIPNRRAFDDMLRLVINARLQGERKNWFGVIIIDIDHFKSFNDTHGHLVGDEVLKNVATWLHEATRATDFIARYGGEEFAMILPNVTHEDLISVAERLRKSVESKKVQSEGLELGVTVSIGAACVDEIRHHEDATELIKAADECLYESKQNGRNRVTSRQLDNQ